MVNETLYEITTRLRVQSWQQKKKSNEYLLQLTAGTWLWFTEVEKLPPRNKKWVRFEIAYREETSEENRRNNEYEQNNSKIIKIYMCVCVCVLVGVSLFVYIYIDR